MHVHLLVNPHAGSGAGRQMAHTASRLLHSVGHQVHVYETTRPKQTIALTKAVLQQHNDWHHTRRLVVVGGDGTLSEAVSALHEMACAVPIGYLPAGTGNDFARNILGRANTSQILTAICTAPSARSVHMLKGTLAHNTHTAVNSIGFGLDAQIAALTNRSSGKKWFKQLAYLSHIVTAFRQRQPFSVTIYCDGQQHHFDQVLLVLLNKNPYFGGGICIDPQTNRYDNTLSVVVVHHITASNIAPLLGRLLTNRSHIQAPQFSRFTGINISVSSPDSIMCQVDGEVLPARPIDCTCQPLQQLFWLP